MFGGMAYKRGILAKKGSAIDVTPNSFSYDSVVATCSLSMVANYGPITGINTVITLSLEGGGDQDYFTCSINNNQPTSFYASTTIAISNGDSFKITCYFSSNINGLVSDIFIYNQSDNNNVLASTSFAIDGCGGP